MRGCFRSKGTTFSAGVPANPVLTAPPEIGLMPSTPFPGHPSREFPFTLRFVMDWLKGFVAMGNTDTLRRRCRVVNPVTSANDRFIAESVGDSNTRSEVVLIRKNRAAPQT